MDGFSLLPKNVNYFLNMTNKPSIVEWLKLFTLIFFRILAKCSFNNRIKLNFIGKDKILILGRKFTLEKNNHSNSLIDINRVLAELKNEDKFQILTGPEIKIAVENGTTLEMELLYLDDILEDIRFRAQYTFNQK